MKTIRTITTQLFLLSLLLLFSNFVQAETTECTVITYLPYVINTQGIYCLKGDLSTSMTSGNAITILTNNVVIDLNSHKIGGLAAGPATDTFGIYALNRQNITIRNGTVRGFFRGIFLEDSSGYTTSQGHLIEDIRADMNTFNGFFIMGRGNMIRNNQVIDTGGATPSSNAIGMEIDGPGNRIINNDVYETVPGGSNDAWIIAINHANGTVVENNRIGNSALSAGISYGIRIASASNTLVTNNRITTMTNGIYYFAGSTGKYRDNITSECTTAYTNGTNIGGNN